MAQILFNIDMDINFNISRRRLAFSSNKSSRESFIYSATPFVPYYKRMKIQSDNPLWSEQVEIEKIALSYTTPAKKNSIPVKQAIDNSSKKGTQCVIGKASAINSMLTPQGESKVINTNICSL